MTRNFDDDLRKQDPEFLANLSDAELRVEIARGNKSALAAVFVRQDKERSRRGERVSLEGPVIKIRPSEAEKLLESQEEEIEGLRKEVEGENEE